MTRPDTIVALATPPGLSAVAVIRISGPEAFDVIHRLCPELEGEEAPRRARLARPRDPDTGEVLDEALVVLFPGPGSYTGEDTAEVSCHGGWLSPALLLEACMRAGAREAQEGEFTRRAYLNGKMDLLQVEAVLDLVEGRSRALHGTALHQLQEGLSTRIGELREGLVDLEALLMHHLDFPEEDEPPVPVVDIVARARELELTMTTLLETAPEGELLREGALTVLAGRPNSGKSSLFNALVGEERAIVTEIPGTTRDALEAVVSLGGFPFRLVDTAGLRDTTGRVEKLGVEVARRYVEGADVILYCLEAGRGLGAEEQAFLEESGRTPVVLIRTKADLEGSRIPEADGSQATVEVSVKTGQGMARLMELLPEMVFGGLIRWGAEAPVLTRRRHSEAIRLARGELRSFGKALREGLPAEVAAAHLRPAETALEELLGVIPREEILDRLFQEFCIGK